MSILEGIIARRKMGRKSIAVLIDPDKADDPARLRNLLTIANENCIDIIMVGGSLVDPLMMPEIIRTIRSEVSIPIVLFPGSPLQITPGADGILFLSLISGRNPDLLIGDHVQTAPLLRNMAMEVLPTGYMLINSGKLTSAAYMSNTLPIPEDKYAIAAATAMAGELLGLKLLYLEAGSGAERPVSPRMISAVRRSVDLPLIVGGGITTPDIAQAALEAGADMLVIGNALEKDAALLTGIAERVYEWNAGTGIRN